VEQSPYRQNTDTGLGPITMSVPDLRRTERSDAGDEPAPVREYSHPKMRTHTVHVYEMGQADPHAELHVAFNRAAFGSLAPVACITSRFARPMKNISTRGPSA
jgi:hypothetical protein